MRGRIASRLKTSLDHEGHRQKLRLAGSGVEHAARDNGHDAAAVLAPLISTHEISTPPLIAAQEITAAPVISAQEITAAPALAPVPDPAGPVLSAVSEPGLAALPEIE